MTERVTGPAFYFPSIEKKYGKPVSYWLDLINSSPLTGHKPLVDWLKAEHGIGHGRAGEVEPALLRRRAEPRGARAHRNGVVALRYSCRS